MKRKRLIIDILVMIFFGASLLACNGNQDTTPKNGILNIDGVSINNENILIYHQAYTKKGVYHSGAELPIVFLLDHFGAKLEWLDHETLRFEFSANIYKLSLSDRRIMKHDENENLIVAVPGNKMSCRILEKEMLLDVVTTAYLFEELGQKIVIDVDYDRLIVSVTTKH